MVFLGAFLLGVALGLPVGYALAACNCLERWWGIIIVVE